MKKPDKRETANLFFSAFLIIAYIVCAHFFTQFTSTLDTIVGEVVSIALYVVFGLLIFYATRVGDGKAIKRFSIVTLIVLVLPSLYIIIASIAPGLPLNDVFAAQGGGVNVIVTLASVALGYGIPYTFLSGFELENEIVAEAEPESSVLEGGVEADVLDDNGDDEKSDSQQDENSENEESETEEYTVVADRETEKAESDSEEQKAE